ncbi:MAG: hypothetical protein ACF8R9_05275 [Phycisphaerales bacterium JB054]
MGWAVVVKAEALRRGLRTAAKRLVAMRPEPRHAQPQHRHALAHAWPCPKAAASRQRHLHAATNELFTDIDASPLWRPRLRLSINN